MYVALWCVGGGNILIRPIMGEGSHYMVVKVIATELVNRGHNVTMLVQDRYGEKLKATAEDKLFNFEFHKSNFTHDEMKNLLQNTTNAGLKGKYYFMKYQVNLRTSDHFQRLVSECDNLIGDVELFTKLRNSKFDVALVDGSLAGVSMGCPIMQFLGAPYVVLSLTFTIQSTFSFANRMPFNPSYVPDMTTDLGDNMSFVERLKNVATSICLACMVDVFHTRPLEKLKASNEHLSDVSMLYTDAELWLINTHFALDYPRPLLPNTVTVGGLTTKDAKPLNNVSLIILFKRALQKEAVFKSNMRRYGHCYF